MKDINMLYKNCVCKLDDINIKVGNIRGVKVNTRAKSRLGRCTKKNSRCEDAYYIIEICSDLLDDSMPDKTAETTMLHELLHTCDGCMNHGYRWQALANKVNNTYGYNVKRTTSYEEAGIKDMRIRTAKHKIVCEKCGKAVYRMRESKLTKYPNCFRCQCGGDLRKEY